MTTSPELVRPPVPERGSTIAIVSPSTPLVAAFPHRVERGTAYLQSLGYEVRLMPNAGLSTGWTAGGGQQRADDINEAFGDPEVSVVLAAIDGNHSAQLFPYLDFELIAENPKMFQGYGLDDESVVRRVEGARAGRRMDRRVPRLGREA